MIPSNGYLCDTIVEQLKDIRKRTSAEVGISLSVDGLKETHDRMRKPG
ncbi:unnamed protein product, partial [marine sediment metagenome]